MRQITSRDGTSIACQQSGKGPALVLVHGVLGSSIRWPILAALEDHFTVYAMERRGRGRSGDAETYSIEREFEDIAAVVEVIGGEVTLLGHSFGGLCVIEAALRTQNIRSLVAYEPAPVPVPSGLVSRIQGLLDAGDREAAVITSLLELAGISESELELFQKSPVFPAMLEAVQTVPRELQAEDAYRLEPEKFKQLRVPALLLLGGESPPLTQAAVQAWHAALPSSRIATLPGQQHIAHYTAPDLFVREVLDFLRNPE